jgi:hypothetical protein
MMATWGGPRLVVSRKASDRGGELDCHRRILSLLGKFCRLVGLPGSSVEVAEVQWCPGAVVKWR